MLLIAAGSRNPLRRRGGAVAGVLPLLHPTLDLSLRYSCSAYEEELTYGPDNYLRYSAVAREAGQFRWRLYTYSHLTSPHHASRIPLYSQQHSASFHQIPQSSESWGCTKIHLFLSTLIILVIAIIKNIHPSFHIPHPTQIQLASRKKNSQSKTAEPAKQTLPRPSPLSCMHNTFHPPNPSTQLPGPPPHLQPVHPLPSAERRKGESV